MPSHQVDASKLTQAVFPDWHEMERIDDLSSEEFDELPFGAIKLDSTGRILAYNAMEESISGRRAEDVLGRDFFTEVAPCTNVQGFAGQFREGVKRRCCHDAGIVESRFRRARARTAADPGARG